MAILGAGAIGRTGSSLCRAEIESLLFELAERVLPNETPMASQAVTTALEGAGVDVRGRRRTRKFAAGLLSYAVEQEFCERAGGAGAVNTEGQILTAGVELNTQSSVEEQREVANSNQHITAAELLELQFTHHADAQARALIQNVLFAPTAKVDGLIVPIAPIRTLKSPALAQRLTRLMSPACRTTPSPLI